MTRATPESQRLQIIADHLNGLQRGVIAGRNGVTESTVQKIVQEFEGFMGEEQSEAHRKFGMTYARTGADPALIQEGYETAIAFGDRGVMKKARELAKGITAMVDEKVNRTALLQTTYDVAARFGNDPDLPLSEIPMRIEQDLEKLRRAKEELQQASIKRQREEELTAETIRIRETARAELQADAAFKQELAKHGITKEHYPKVTRMLNEFEKAGKEIKKLFGKLDEIERYPEIASQWTKQISTLKNEESAISKRLGNVKNAQEYGRIATQYGVVPKYIEGIAAQVSAIAAQKGVDKNEAARYFGEKMAEYYPKVIDFNKLVENEQKALESKRAEKAQLIDLEIPSLQGKVSYLLSRSKAMSKLESLMDQGVSAEWIVANLEQLAISTEALIATQKKKEEADMALAEVYAEIHSSKITLEIIKDFIKVKMDRPMQQRLISIIKRIAEKNAVSESAVWDKLLKDIESQYVLKDGFEKAISELKQRESEARVNLRAFENKIENSFNKIEKAEGDLQRVYDQINEAKSFFEKPEGILSVLYLASKGNKVDYIDLMGDVTWAVHFVKSRIDQKGPLFGILQNLYHELREWTEMIPLDDKHKLV